MRRRAVIAALALLAFSAAPAHAEIRQIEAEGAVLLTSPSVRAAPPRDEAVRRALVEAVNQVAMDLLPGSDRFDAEYLPEVLGKDPLAYATRYRVIEDLGERPAIRSGVPDNSFEYVVLIEAHIDTDRVRWRLVEAGMLARRNPQADQRELLVVVEAVDSFAAYDALRRTLLEGPQVERVVPIEMARNRAVLQVSASGGPGRLLEDLLRAAPPHLVVTPLGSDDHVLWLRVGLVESPTGAAAGGARSRLGRAAAGD